MARARPPFRVRQDRDPEVALVRRILDELDPRRASSCWPRAGSTMTWRIADCNLSPAAVLESRGRSRPVGPWVLQVVSEIAPVGVSSRYANLDLVGAARPGGVDSRRLLLFP